MASQWQIVSAPLEAALFPCKKRKEAAEVKVAQSLSRVETLPNPAPVRPCWPGTALAEGNGTDMSHK